MKKKHLALILAAAMTVTSVDATALVSAADFSAEETAVQAEEETVAAEDETEEETEETAEDASEEEVLTEAEDGEDLTAETEITEDAEEVTAEEEDSEDVELFSSEEETEAVGDTNVEALTLGEAKTVSIAENDFVWLSFRPAADGTYCFESSNNSRSEDSDDDYYDPEAYLYQSMNDNEYIDHDDEGGYNNNFKLIKKLNKNTTYYLKVKEYNDEACSYDVTVSKIIGVSSLTLEKGTARTTYYSGGLDDYNGISFNGAKLTVKYDNDTSQTYNLQSSYYEDEYGNTFNIKCSDGKKEYDFSEDGDPFKNGTYQVYVKGYPKSGFNITVTSQDYSKLTAVKTGKNTVGVRYDDYVWYKYVPEDTSCFEFNAYFTNNNNTSYLSTGIKTITGDGRIVSYSYWLDANNRFGDAGYQLIKGKTYFIGVNNYNSASQTTATLEITRLELTGCKWKTTSTKNATCGTAGQKVEACSTHAGETRTTTIPATGKHTYSWKVTKPATVFAEGVNSNVCSVCGKVAATKAIAKLSPKLTMSVASKKTVPLKVKQSYAVKTVDIANGDKIVSWTSSNKKVVTVKNGKITGKKKGTAKITVKLASGYTTWFKVKVQAPVVKTTSLKVTDKATGAKVGKKVTLSRKAKLSLSTVVAPVTSKQKVTYSTSNKKVATVSSKGVITAKKKGTATITVKSGSKSVKIKVKVK